jgi:hypothetical protein
MAWCLVKINHRDNFTFTLCLSEGVQNNNGNVFAEELAPQPDIRLYHGDVGQTETLLRPRELAER